MEFHHLFSLHRKATSTCSKSDDAPPGRLGTGRGRTDSLPDTEPSSGTRQVAEDPSPLDGLFYLQHLQTPHHSASHSFLSSEPLVITRVNSPWTDLHKGNWRTREEDGEEEEGLPAPDIRESTNQWGT